MPVDLLQLIVLLFCAAAAAGLLSGLLGVGGGIVIVPVLLSFFQYQGIALDIAMPLAVGSSLLVVAANGFSSSRAHIKRGNCDLALVKRVAVWVVIGALLGHWFAIWLGGRLVSSVFGCVSILSALQLAVFTEVKRFQSALPGAYVQACVAACVAALAVVMGIGGGTFTVPLLTLCGFSGHKAVGTSAVIGCVLAVPGALAAMLLAGPIPDEALWGTVGNVNLLAAVLIIPVSILMAPIGVKINKAAQFTLYE